MLLGLVGSRLGFFSNGWTTACLKQDGTVPVVKELFMTERKPGPNVFNSCLSRGVGTMSRQHVVAFIEETISVRVDSVMGLKQSRVDEQVI